MVMQTDSRFPALADRVKALVEEHRELKDEPLLLAVYYAPERQPQDVFLFEIVDGFGNNDVDPDREMFEVTYAATPALPLAADQELHLIITNPTELKVALEQGWELVTELRDAKRDGKAEVIYSGPRGKNLWESING